MSGRVRVAAMLLLAAWVTVVAAGPAWMLLLATALVAQGGRMVRVDLIEHGTGRRPRRRQEVGR